MKIDNISTHPAVKEANEKLASLWSRRGHLQKRRAEAEADLERLSGSADVDALAVRLLKGEDVTTAEAQRVEAELQAARSALAGVERELLIVQRAEEMAERQVEAAKREAERAGRAPLAEHLRGLDRAAAEAFAALAQARQERYALGAQLAEAGYPELGYGAMSEGVWPELGSLSDGTSIVSLQLEALRERGLLPRAKQRRTA